MEPKHTHPRVKRRLNKYLHQSCWGSFFRFEVKFKLHDIRCSGTAFVGSWWSFGISRKGFEENLVKSQMESKLHCYINAPFNFFCTQLHLWSYYTEWLDVWRELFRLYDKVRFSESFDKNDWFLINIENCRVWAGDIEVLYGGFGSRCDQWKKVA